MLWVIVSHEFVPIGVHLFKEGSSVLSKIMVYKRPFIFTSKVQMGVLSRQLVVALMKLQ